ncbi:hypothetical protein AALP_AA6G026900 [Arabis alpina]|uniref:Phorbol-ester/DAG-type domain-containing protein n=1 Tax=Arabis alpina TaxID=50452 RepID=A0A087GLP1_ARAAL|nr:hypothetical protein AALP_AA6G026900 [Arabis alpina]
METDERVSLPWIHKHLMVPWNHLGKGDCCGRFESITDGFYCEECEFFVHKKCSELSEYIQHPSHSGHTLQHQKRNLHHNCDLCGRGIKNLLYRCEVCDFDMDLYCAKYPPPEVIDVSEKHHHHHKLTFLKRHYKFDCGVKCGKIGEDEFFYKCYECDLTFHIDCVWHPLEVNHSLNYSYTTMDAGKRVSLPWNDMRKSDFHKKCYEEAPESIKHSSHSIHRLWLQFTSLFGCNLCGKPIMDLSYHCKICGFNIDIYCVKYPLPEVIDNPEAHHHKLTLLKKHINFDCDAKCGKTSENEFHYKCDECTLAFHVDCVWHRPEVEHLSEVNHTHHSLHPLKLVVMDRLLEYSDGKCRLCERKIDHRMFYHCSSCNFTLDMRCVIKPPPRFLMDLKAHDHQLTLFPRLDSFTCNACGLKGDRSPYVCFQCGFMIHQNCLALPRVININRHDHRVSRTSVLGVVNSVCRVCREKVDWTCGGYSCQSCLVYVVHSKCATRDDVWNGKELEGVPEEIEDIEPYVVIDENTIQHFSHKEHYLRLHVDGVLYEENKRCSACIYPIGLQSFYGCIICDFVLHQNCAEFPKKKWHVVHNERLTLVTGKAGYFQCDACFRFSNGFVYKHEEMELDVRCGSIIEPFVHPSHPQHPLYYIPGSQKEICNGCNLKESYVLRCIEDGCEFVLGFSCATLPQEVKHRVDDHPLSLCYGEEEASGKYWCDIFETESDPRKWFYTCKDHRACLHTECVLGDCAGFMPRSTLEYDDNKPFEVVLNDSVTRPFCNMCKSRCMYPMILKKLGTSETYCSYYCT